jgi:hypothetical protein
MKWIVIYRPVAENELASIWLSSPDPEAVANAADEIDRLLASNPLDSGESRGDTTRIIVQRPLTILFDVFPDDALVEVFAVSYWRGRKQ